MCQNAHTETHILLYGSVGISLCTQPLNGELRWLRTRGQSIIVLRTSHDERVPIMRLRKAAGACRCRGLRLLRACSLRGRGRRSNGSCRR